MQGCCVELHGLVENAQYNTKRGIITNRDSKSVTVQLDVSPFKTVHVEIENMCVVFCLGLPRESRISIKHTKFDENSLSRAIHSIDSTKFYVFYLGESSDSVNDIWQHFACVRIPFFTMAMDAIIKKDREPLLRIYIASYSQDDPSASIIFGETMKSPSDAPAFVDLTTGQFCERCTPSIMSSNIENEIKRCSIPDKIKQTDTSVV